MMDFGGVKMSDQIEDNALYIWIRPSGHYNLLFLDQEGVKAVTAVKFIVQSNRWSNFKLRED